MAQSATTIYLDKEQRRKLYELAEINGTSFSSEVRSAIDRYVEAKADIISEEEAEVLIRQTNESIDRMAKALDDAHKTVSAIVKQKPAKRRK